ncbi:dolichyl-diphosphooligosaccharide--protein glycosyltransferase subunit stt3a [Anaeramoeba flamelloides]|uniref:dolichyl-diphosphooligosaccharide--protein glycotransferase n=1 Tax=Anaeramoeba flamelloides TaxID=1746091 RepID=A0ABQ8X6N1_9EUKA|nr:dolichyl-diphosphooligosaccharide--protein glycosyltransferase subunit stt3a [Anaeramoeba flamelloides]
MKSISSLFQKGVRRDSAHRYLILGLIYVLAFSVRLFSVLRFESVIHEFDPYFNYRSTIYLVENGFFKFLNWFDNMSWYPLGRVVGGTVFPGIMLTAGTLYFFLKKIVRITVHIKHVCVFMGPFFASNASLITYLFTKEVSKDYGAGLISAVMIAIVPGYISRSVAGSFDNECIAIFALILTYYLWLKAVNTGSMFYAASCALAYLYMVSSWGGYVFIMNLIPLHAFVLILVGRYSRRLYVSYTTLYILGTLLSMQVPFVGFQAVQSSEHLAGMGIFGLIQLVAAVKYVKSILGEKYFKLFLKILGFIAVSILVLFVAVGFATGYIAPWTGRFLSLLDPTYAKKYIPIIASVSEHQPTAWSSYFFDLQSLVFLYPVGLYYCFKNPSDSKIFLILYAVTSTYFTGVMVRLMLVLAPICVILGSMALSNMFKLFAYKIREYDEEIKNKNKNQANNKQNTKQKKKKKTEEKKIFNLGYIAATLMIALLTALFISYIFHSIWVTSEAYSSPSIVLAARGHDGNRIIFDDFREAYYWLRQNTAPDAKIMSWWDYGYQITAMANRTVLVDNNTWNNTHIGTVGKAMVKTENISAQVMEEHDVDYVLVLFGGLIGYSSDDINKYLWLVRIGGTVDPSIKEEDYLNSRKEFRVDSHGAPAFLNSMMYKLCFYRFWEVKTEGNRPSGYDRVRNTVMGNQNYELEAVEEAFTSEHWIVRIYKVLKKENRK